ncbi:MAG: hypothetical protein DBP03_15950 [gamma proteobacterium symbiont of Ctena orbiculata]|nr:MAG: hypothetical protein DBP03_15950 [gamma proteobacterium symbiont of Ctena orbiculata]
MPVNFRGDIGGDKTSSHQTLIYIIRGGEKPPPVARQDPGFLSSRGWPRAAGQGLEMTGILMWNNFLDLIN